jgi:ribosome assembly protein YihI (activator of Der GTPase)
LIDRPCRGRVGPCGKKHWVPISYKAIHSPHKYQTHKKIKKIPPHKKIPRPHAKNKHKNNLPQKNPPPKKSPKTLLELLEGCVCWLVNSLSENLHEIDWSANRISFSDDI